MKYLVLSLLFLVGCTIPKRTCVQESTPIKKIHSCQYRGKCAVETEDGKIVLDGTTTKIGDTVCLKYGMKVVK